MLHKEVEQSRFRQLWQMPEYLISYQMETTRLGLQPKIYLPCHQNFISFVEAEKEQN